MNLVRSLHLLNSLLGSIYLLVAVTVVSLGGSSKCGR